jgi:AP-4 complex subunit mu-1
LQIIDGVSYFFAKKFGIYFVATTKQNSAPGPVIDIIYRLMKMIRDYCGVLNEESIRKNFVLIYEIIDEAIDYGHAQLVTTEQIRQFIVNEPVLLAEQIKAENKKKSSWKPNFFKQTAVSSSAIQKPI